MDKKIIIAESGFNSIKADSVTGKLYYSYEVSDDIGFTFSLLSEIGEPYKQWFYDVMKNIPYKTVETHKDYYQALEKIIMDKNTKMFIESEMVTVKPFSTFPQYGITIVLRSGHGSTKHISINAEQFDKIKKILLCE